MYGSQTTNAVYNAQQILVVVLEFTNEARGFVINFLCGPRGEKGWTGLAYCSKIKK